VSLPPGFTGFREEIDPKAFDETLAKGPDVRFTFNHNPSK
jgi:phage head maturation protease